MHTENINNGFILSVHIFEL
ncbi:unnamed protein product [Acanthoscelides obtectus]|uniref:Uncharacterized protein n=1 Tax=Acanthoscelides obtectus TaxID=200917 RepID=A0A9P0PDE5_ACAOB|nr:unnamed protein product [Acanthoscelides obtectus]CAK1654880.1 hypothetical protein AOBTE_LOCUS18909 [Acanthoscelides obtectus]